MGREPSLMTCTWPWNPPGPWLSTRYLTTIVGADLGVLGDERGATRGSVVRGDDVVPGEGTPAAGRGVLRVRCGRGAAGAEGLAEAVGGCADAVRGRLGAAPCPPPVVPVVPDKRSAEVPRTAAATTPASVAATAKANVRREPNGPMPAERPRGGTIAAPQ
jgi:hypothetical protein